MVSTSPDSVGFWSSAQWLSRQGLLGVIMIRPCSYQFILEDVLFCCCMLMISNWLVITPLPYRWSSVAFINYLLWRRWRALSLFLAWRSHILLVDIWYLRSNNVMTWSLELNSMMRRLLTLPWSFTLNSVRLMAHHYLIWRSTDSRSAVWFIWRSLAQMAFPKKVSLSWLPPGQFTLQQFIGFLDIFEVPFLEPSFFPSSSSLELRATTDADWAFR